MSIVFSAILKNFAAAKRPPKNYSFWLSFSQIAVSEVSGNPGSLSFWHQESSPMISRWLAQGIGRLYERNLQTKCTKKKILIKLFCLLKSSTCSCQKRKTYIKKYAEILTSLKKKVPKKNPLSKNFVSTNPARSPAPVPRNLVTKVGVLTLAVVPWPHAGP